MNEHQYYDCPLCYGDVLVKEKDVVVSCPSCQARLVVNRDAEFDDGAWHDLTTLSEQKEQK